MAVFIRMQQKSQISELFFQWIFVLFLKHLGEHLAGHDYYTIHFFYLLKFKTLFEIPQKLTPPITNIPIIIYYFSFSHFYSGFFWPFIIPHHFTATATVTHTLLDITAIFISTRLIWHKMTLEGLTECRVTPHQPTHVTLWYCRLISSVFVLIAWTGTWTWMVLGTQGVLGLEVVQCVFQSKCLHFIRHLLEFLISAAPMGFKVFSSHKLVLCLLEENILF